MKILCRRNKLEKKVYGWYNVGEKWGMGVVGKHRDDGNLVKTGE